MTQATSDLKTFANIRSWIVEHVAARVGMNASALDPRERFQKLGMDSMGVMAMLESLSAAMKRSIASTLAWERPTPTTAIGSSPTALDAASRVASGAAPSAK